MGNLVLKFPHFSPRWLAFCQTWCLFSGMAVAPVQPPRMKASSPTSPPRLAPPGAGIPWIERQVASFLLRRRTKAYEKNAANLVIRDQRSAIEQLWKVTPSAKRNLRVLIPRPPGLEDSSRFWSVNMVLDHLRIANESIAGVIQELGREHIPPGKASTADVKPSPDCSDDVFFPFQAACEEIEDVVSRLPEMRTHATYTHPWFGPLNAAQWHLMAGFHMRLHLAQIQTIRRLAG